MKGKESLADRLAKRPALAARFEALLDLVESRDSEMFNADHAEEVTIDGVRNLGNQILQDWAEDKAEFLAGEVTSQVSPVKSSGKKNFTG